MRKFSKNPSHVMVDIETLGVQANSVIVCIGAMRFDRQSYPCDYVKSLSLSTQRNLVVTENLFYCRINIEKSITDGMTTDQDTFSWWKQQEPHIREEALGGIQSERIDPKEAMIAFTSWISRSFVSEVWAQGPTFDIIMLENAMKRYNLKIPWKFFEIRDARTLTNVVGIYRKHDETLVQEEMLRLGIILPPLPERCRSPHNALYDCWVQVLAVIKAMRIVNKLEK